MSVYLRLLGELDANGQRLSEQISEIDLTDPEDARVLMPEPGTDIVAHFGVERFLERYQRYKAHIAEWRQQYPKLAAVDLRYESQVVLEMQPGVNAAQQAAAATTTQPASNAKALEAKADAPAKSASNAKTVKSPGSTGVKASTKPQSEQAAAIKAATLRDKKKRAEQKRAALNLSKQKPKPHPGTAAGQGQ
jgi:cell division protein FtsQ